MPKTVHSSQQYSIYDLRIRFKFSPHKGPPVARKTLQWESPELSQTPRAGPHCDGSMLVFSLAGRSLAGNNGSECCGVLHEKTAAGIEGFALLRNTHMIAC